MTDPIEKILDAPILKVTAFDLRDKPNGNFEIRAMVDGIGWTLFLPEIQAVVFKVTNNEEREIIFRGINYAPEV